MVCLWTVSHGKSCIIWSKWGFYIFCLYLIFVLFIFHKNWQNTVKILYWTIIIFWIYLSLSYTIFHIYTHMSECLYHQIVMNILSVSVDSKLTVLEFIISWGFPFRLPMDVIIIAVKTVSCFHISDKCDCCDGKYH